MDLVVYLIQFVNALLPILFENLFDAVQNDLPEVQMCGPGNASREYLYVEDATESFVIVV